MGSSLHYLYYHAVFSTHKRVPVHVDQERLHAYIGGLITEMRGQACCIGGMPDHVHAYFSLPPMQSISNALKLIKGRSSTWINQEWPNQGRFSWQRGYAVFSVSHSQSNRVINYIAHQKEHHSTSSFKDELLALLKRHGIQYDERYLWD